MRYHFCRPVTRPIFPIMKSKECILINWQVIKKWSVFLPASVPQQVFFKHKDEYSFIMNVKFELGPSFYEDIFMIVFTTGPALITRSRFSNQDVGGPLSFLSSAGINLIPFWRISIAYRLQHMSNANLFRTNHRLNLHILELNYLF